MGRSHEVAAVHSQCTDFEFRQDPFSISYDAFARKEVNMKRKRNEAIRLPIVDVDLALAAFSRSFTKQSLIGARRQVV